MSVGPGTTAHHPEARWSPRFLRTLDDDPAAPLVLRAYDLLPEEADGLRAAAIAAGAQFVAGPGGALVVGTLLEHAALVDKLAGHGEWAESLADQVRKALRFQFGPPPAPTRLGNTQLTWGQRTYVMGILNLSPDSFSGDALPDVGAAVAQARAFVAAGADILDVGGESTRPGAPPLSAEAELARVLPVLRALREAVALPLSIDTYKAPVAAAALAVGASIVNDVTGLRADPDLARVAARFDAPLILTHNRPATASSGPLGPHHAAVAYTDLLREVVRDLRASRNQAVHAGVAVEQILLDPGIGFGKTREQNLELLARLAELRVLGRPILLGTSRKSVIGLTLNLPPDQREEGTAATVALGIRAGADVVRVHDVRSMALVAHLADAVVRGTGLY
jgi:dihydropteroate synthase